MHPLMVAPAAVFFKNRCVLLRAGQGCCTLDSHMSPKGAGNLLGHLPFAVANLLFASAERALRVSDFPLKIASPAVLKQNPMVHPYGAPR